MLGAKRDGGVTAESSRGLLVTLLGEFMLLQPARAWTQTLIEALRLVGVQEKAARQIISRLHARGWLHSERVGRRTCWSLTRLSEGLLSTGAQRIYGFGSSSAPNWEQRWVLLLVSVPESRRNLRYRLNIGLTWAGFGSLGQGTWISPWPDREGEAVSTLESLNIEHATSFTAELGRLGTGAELARRAWDLPDLHDQYRKFLTAIEGPPSRDPATCARELVGLVHRWRRFPFLDPGLPAELLPDDWPGRPAAIRFTERREQLLPMAHKWWIDTEARFS